MCSHRLVLAVICSLFVFQIHGSSVYASDAEIELILKKGFSIKNLMEIALERNPKLKAAKAKWKAVIERYPQVTALEDPEVGIDTWNIPTDFSLNETRNTIYWISQKFPFPGKLKIKGDIVSKEVKAARTRFEMAARDLGVELKSYYFELVYLTKASHIILQNKSLAKQLAKFSATEYSVDATTLNDVLKAQSQLAQLENDLILLRELRMNEVAHINTLLDLPPDQPIGKPSEISFVPFNIELNQLYQLARQNQLELKINGIEIEKSREKIKLAKKKYYPDFRATFKWFDNNGIPQDEGFGILVGARIPLWLGKNRSRVAEAQHNLRALEFEKKDLQNQAFAEINKIYFKIQNSSRLVRLYQQSLIPQAWKSIEIAEDWYKQNRGSFTGLLEARSIWLNFSLAHQRALADYFQSIARLEKIIGVNMEITKNKENQP